MYRIALLVVFLIVSSSAFAQPLSKQEFELLRNEIRDNYAQSPKVALQDLNSLIKTGDFTPDQTLVLLNYKAWFELEAKHFSDAMRTLVSYKSLAQRSTRPGLLYGYYNISGGIYTQLNLHQLALENFSKALEYAELLNDDITNQTLNNMGEVYYALEMFDEAEQAFRRYLTYLAPSNKPLDISIATINLARVLIAKQQYHEAEALVLEQSQIQTQQQFNYLLADSHLLMADIQSAQQHFAVALEHINKSLAIFNDQQMKSNEIKARFKLAKLYEQMAETDKASAQLAIVSNDASTRSDLTFASKVYEFQSLMLEESGQFKKAIASYKKHREAQNQLTARQADVNLAKALAEADLNAKEVEIAELTREKQLKAAKATGFKNLFIAVAISLLIILIGSYLAITNIHKRKQRLSDALDELEQTQANLIEAEKMASLTALVSGMAHQLNTPIGTAITAGSYLTDNLQQLEQQFKDKTLHPNDLTNFIKNSGDANSLILNNINRVATMIDEFKALNVSISLNKPMSEIAIKHTLCEQVDTLHNNFAKQISYTVEGDEVNIVTYPSIIADVLKTLVINAYEHGFNDVDDAKISINIEQHNDSIKITFQDNGSGIDNAILKDIFTPFYSTNLGGNHLGLGLNVVFNAVKYNLFGNICAEPCEHGACFVLTLPIDGPKAAKEHNEAIK